MGTYWISWFASFFSIGMNFAFNSMSKDLFLGNYAWNLLRSAVSFVRWIMYENVTLKGVKWVFLLFWNFFNLKMTLHGVTGVHEITWELVENLRSLKSIGSPRPLKWPYRILMTMDFWNCSYFVHVKWIKSAP